MPVTLSQPFARSNNVEPSDVQQVKKALNRLGYYQPNVKTGITDIVDVAVFDALKAFQRDHALPVTGSAKPDDDTIAALNREMGKTSDGVYIWRTVEDNKVRKEHAIFNRTIRRWDDSPDPGEDPNCRCWAEPVTGGILKGIPDEKLFSFFEKHENNIEWMYLDTKGYVTVGVGLMLPNEEAAIKLPFYKLVGTGQRPATEHEIRQAYRKIKTMPYGQNIGAEKFDPKEYTAYDDIFIDKSVGLQKLRTRLPEDLKSLRRKFKDFDSFPLEVQQALLDMEYNLGPTKFRDEKGKWPKLFAAVRREDWVEASRESHRKDIQESRNDDIRDLFLKAAGR